MVNNNFFLHSSSLSIWVPLCYSIYFVFLVCVLKLYDVLKLKISFCVLYFLAYKLKFFVGLIGFSCVVVQLFLWCYCSIILVLLLTPLVILLFDSYNVATQLLSVTLLFGSSCVATQFLLQYCYSIFLVLLVNSFYKIVVWLLLCCYLILLLSLLFGFSNGATWLLLQCCCWALLVLLFNS